MQRIHIVDYGMGNLHSVQKAFAFLGAQPVLTQDAAQIEQAERLVLPGVGAFADAMAELERLRLTDAVRKAADKGTPLLGICLGMQLLFESSAEGGGCPGLGLLEGRIEKLPDKGLKIPHMGWNTVVNQDEVFFAALPEAFSVYFVHSFAALDTGKPYVAGVTEYGVPFACAVRQGNVFGAQFHPENSGEIGMQILRNFLAYQVEA